MALRRNPDGSITQMGGVVGMPTQGPGAYGGGLAGRASSVQMPQPPSYGGQSYGGYGQQPRQRQFDYSNPISSGPMWGGNSQSMAERTSGGGGNAQQGYSYGPNGVKYWGYDNVAIGGHSAGSSAPAHNPLTSVNAVAAMGGGFGGYGRGGIGGGAGAITPGGGGTGRVAGAVGGGGAGDLASLLQQYQDQANADNQGRYDQGLGIINTGQADQLSQLSAGRDRQNAIAGSISDTALTREQRRTQQESAATTARLYGMGLAKTTGAILANQGVLDRGSERENAVADQGKKLQLGIEQGYDSSLQNTLPSNRRELTSWIYNKDVQGPDVGLYANLLSRAGANGQSGRGGGALIGGGGGFSRGGGGGRRGGGFNLSGGGDSGYNGSQNVNSTGYGGYGRGGGGIGGAGGQPFQSGAGLYDQYGTGGTPGAWDPSMNQGSNYTGDPLDLGGGGGGVDWSDAAGPLQRGDAMGADVVNQTYPDLYPDVTNAVGGAASFGLYGGYGGGGGASNPIISGGTDPAADPNSPQYSGQMANVPVGAVVTGPDGKQWRKGPSGMFYPA